MPAPSPGTPRPGGPAAHGLTTGAVARRLGVSATTVRSWDQRYGVGPAARQDGRHRRWAPADVAVLEEMCRLTASGVPPAEAARAALGTRGPGAPETAPGVPAPDPEASPGQPAPEDLRRTSRGLARAAVRLDGPALDALLRRAVARHGLVPAWEEVMVPALHAVGRRWEAAGDRYVEVEHLLSWHVSTALRQLVPPGRGTAPDAPPVLLACVPAEQHTLPLEALAAGLAERGLPTRMLGAAVPAEALDSAVRRTGPAAVVLWSQARSTAGHALARHVAGTSFGVRGARTRPLVLLAGPGWAGRLPEAGMQRPGSLREALDLLARRYGR
ncbi:MerR family transcriptional regulator [Streptomyces sp. NPDC058855]|uniref:MerR family transcriptional regulator n=1 Tax=Streptomyces sp. NPDC058855 TaxID=3346651 RepID=UPI0036A967F0